MASIRGYDGPPIDLACVRAYTKVFKEKHERGPTEDELVKRVHNDMYSALSEEWMRERVVGAVDIGVDIGALERRTEEGEERIYYVEDW